MKLQYVDSTHSYWLDGRRVKSASKVADIAADKYTIEQWGKRQVAIGMTLDPTLAERVAVDLDNREAIQQVCDDAKTVAKADARAHRGTQRHRVFELTLLGQTEFITDQQRNDAAVLRRTLDAYGLEPIAGRVEQFVAWPEHGVVGRYDAILMYQGAPALFDLKGGPNSVLYPHSTLAQCALYLFAPHTSANVERDGDRSTVTEWTTMPDGIDFENAYVIYCDDDHEIGELWRLDMQHGLAAATLALSMVDWRKAHNYGKDAVSKVAAPAVLPSAAGQPAAVPAQDTAGTAATTFHHRRHMLLNRYKQLSPALKKQFRARNPGESNLDDIAALLDELENPPNIRQLAAQTSAIKPPQPAA